MNKKALRGCDNPILRGPYYTQELRKWKSKDHRVNDFCRRKKPRSGSKPLKSIGKSKGEIRPGPGPTEHSGSDRGSSTLETKIEPHLCIGDENDP